MTKDTQQVEGLEEIAERVLGVPSQNGYGEVLRLVLSDPAILAHIPAVKALQEEVERFSTALSEANTNRMAMHAKIATLEATNAAQAEQLAAKQAKIDALMLEFCSAEMTPEQVEEWSKHQVPESQLAGGNDECK